MRCEECEYWVISSKYGNYCECIGNRPCDTMYKRDKRYKAIKKKIKFKEYE